MKILIDSYYESIYTHSMSTRLQVLFPEDELKQLSKIAKKKRVPVARIVRESVRQYILGEPHKRDPGSRIAAILRYSRHNGPTGDIEDILAQIEAGRNAQ